MSDGRRLVKLTETLEDFDFSSLYYGIKNYYRRPNFSSFSLNAQHTIYNMMMLCYERSANEVSKRYALQSRALLFTVTAMIHKVIVVYCMLYLLPTHTFLRLS